MQDMSEKAKVLMEYDVKLNAWLRDSMIPQLARIFNKTCSSKNIHYTIAEPAGSFFLSDLFFLNISFAGEEKRILVKLIPLEFERRSAQKYDDLFANEILFYKKLAKSAAKNYPTYYLGGEDKIFSKFIVMENICTRGYFNCPNKINVPLDFIAAGLRSIARLHGNSYMLKEHDYEKFLKIVNGISNFRYDIRDPLNMTFNDFICSRVKRVTQQLKKRNYDPNFTAKIEMLFENCFKNVMIKSTEPIEPLATIIHGDCTINNILFRRLGDERTGSLEAMLVDFGLIMYSSPALDVVTFVYTCCSRMDIKERFEELFGIYYDSLIECLYEKKIFNESKYSYNALYSEYRRCALFGYLITCFFLPLMTEYDYDNEIISYGIPHLQELSISGGGDSMSNLLVDMLIDMREAELLHYYINNDKPNIVDTL